MPKGMSLNLLMAVKPAGTCVCRCFGCSYCRAEPNESADGIRRVISAILFPDDGDGHVARPSQPRAQRPWLCGSLALCLCYLGDGGLRFSTRLWGDGRSPFLARYGPALDRSWARLWCCTRLLRHC